MDPQVPYKICLKLAVSPEYMPPQFKSYHDTFPWMRMGKYLQCELFSNFPLKPVAKNIVFGSLATHFMLITIKFDLYVLVLLFKINFEVGNQRDRANNHLRLVNLNSLQLIRIN